MNNQTHFQHYLWPYALRGSVTIVVENTSIENFERTIYRYLRQSIAKIIRKFCSISREICLSPNTDAIRADHVIIQSYEEQLDDRRLYVAIFIKDPYRQDIALTNEQFLLALKRHRQQLYHDIKHHINLPSDLFQQTSLDPIWLYGVCLLALLVLVVVILMLITILAKRTIKTKAFDQSISNVHQHREKSSTPIQLAIDEDEDSSSIYKETDSSQTSSSLMPVANPLPPPIRTSYFNSAFETAIKQHLHDDEPIPFIDENLSVTHSRKSSACWSDRTSLSSRFGLAWKRNFIRSIHFYQEPSGTRRFNYRTVRYPIPLSSKQFHFHDPL